MERLEDLLTKEQFSAIELLRTTMGFDPAQDPSMWEHLLAQITAGVTTTKSESYDIDLMGTFVEVKYSSEFTSQLSKGKSQVFRWTGIWGHGKTKKKATILILVGLDADRNVWFWVLPYSAVGNTNTVTVVTPSSRFGPKKGNLDSYRCESSDILPMILHYDRERSAETCTALEHHINREASDN